MICAAPATATAQLIDRYFPDGVPGYGAAAGVTVQSRNRAATEPLGTRIGGWILKPSIAEAVGFTDNATGTSSGTAGRRASALVNTAAALLAASQWSRNGLGAFLSFDDTRYLAATSQSTTNWTAALGGALDIGRARLTVAASHLDLTQTSRALDGLPIDRPGRFQVSNARAAHRFDLNRLSIEPGVSLTAYRYDDVSVAGQRVVQRFRNRNVAEANVTLRYALAPLRDIVVDLRGTSFDHVNPQPGAANRDANTLAVLAGLDYALDAVWRYRVLAGFQVRRFASPALGTTSAPIAEAALVWTPSGLTTLSATLSRRIEDAAELAAVSYTFSQARLVLDHELRRDLLLRVYVDLQRADYQQRIAANTYVNAGLGATWLIDRRMRLGATFDHATRQRAGGGGYDENIYLLRLRFSL